MTHAPWPPLFEATLRTYLPRLDGAQPVTGDLALADYGLDSLATVGLLLELEDRFAVSIPDELLTVTSFASPDSIWAVLAQLTGVGQVAGDPPPAR